MWNTKVKVIPIVIGHQRLGKNRETRNQRKNQDHLDNRIVKIGLNT